MKTEWLITDVTAAGKYSWIAHQLHIGTSLGRHHNYICPISNMRPILDSLAKTTQGKLLDIFGKT